jgi:hypothetical protein
LWCVGKRKETKEERTNSFKIDFDCHPSSSYLPPPLSSSPQITNPQQNRDFKRKQLAIDANRDLHLRKNVKFFMF